MGFSIVKEVKCAGCYGIGKVFRDNKEWIAAVSEAEGNGVIDLIDPDTFATVRASEGPGGGMNIIPIPKKQGEFFCIQKFFPVFKSEDAVVVWGYERNGKYVTKEVQSLPFVHRIELITIGKTDYLMCASLCKAKKFKEDWSCPGSIYIGEIDYANREIHGFQMIYTGVIQNHGLTKTGLAGEEGILVSGENGVNRLIPPGSSQEEWTVINEIREPTSDCVIADIDGDGEYEFGTIAPFHGKNFNVYKRMGKELKKIYTLPGEFEFGHAVWGGELNGRNVFLAGYRGAGKELYLIESVHGKIKAQLVDSGKGPANVTVVKSRAGDLIGAANRESDRYTIYKENK